MKHYKVVYDTQVQRYFVFSRVKGGAWLQVSKPYKSKRYACIRLNMLAFSISYKQATDMYYYETQETR